MAKSGIVLLILCLIHAGTCTNKVPILINKDTNDCSDCQCTVGIPIKSTSILNEFTFCGKYSFKFLKDAVLMYMNTPQVYIRMMNFKDKVGLLMYNLRTFFFSFDNQNMKPDSWQHFCISVKLDSIKLVINGDIVFDAPPPNAELKTFKETNLWLGGENIPKWMNRRFEGMITDAYLWPESFKAEELVLITNNNKESKAVPIKPLFSWNDFKVPTGRFDSCIDYHALDRDDKIFKESQGEEIHLIEQINDFESSNFICKAIGGHLFVPQNNHDLNRIGSYIENSEKCTKAYIGVKKMNGNLVDLDKNDVSFANWYIGEPNGQEYEECVSIVGKSEYSNESKYIDVNCLERYCFACKMSTKNMYTLRGKLPKDIDRYYYVSFSGRNTEIRGISGTHCIWNKTWNFGPTLKLYNNNSDPIIPPIGLQNWSNGQELKFTQCNDNEFTCKEYGYCISLHKRCNGHPDCLDGSDETECKIMTLQKGYNKKYPPWNGSPVIVSLFMEIYNIPEIKELDMKFKVNLLVQMTWFDSRILFRNIGEAHMNTEEIKEIWTPKLFFGNSMIGVIEAGQHKFEDVEEFVGAGYVDVNGHGNRKPQKNNVEELNEDYVYPGKDNAIRMKNYIFVMLDCEFDLKM